MLGGGLQVRPPTYFSAPKGADQPRRFYRGRPQSAFFLCPFRPGFTVRPEIPPQKTEQATAKKHRRNRHDLHQELVLVDRQQGSERLRSCQVVIRF